MVKNVASVPFVYVLFFYYSLDETCHTVNSLVESEKLHRLCIR